MFNCEVLNQKRDKREAHTRGLKLGGGILTEKIFSSTGKKTRLPKYEWENKTGRLKKKNRLPSDPSTGGSGKWGRDEKKSVVRPGGFSIEPPGFPPRP